MQEESFKVVGASSKAGCLEDWICKSHLTKKWDRNFLVPVDPSLDARAKTALWKNYSTKSRVLVYYDFIEDGIPQGIKYGVLLPQT